ncbi:putative RNA helicase [Helianthus debilis subsp. tardiflorus]
MGWKPIGPALVYVVYMGSTESQDPNEIVLHNRRILSSEPMGVILVFLTGQDDIHTAVQLITEEAQNNGKSSLVLIVLPLYSGLTRADQDLVFSPSPRGKRKVVISTNIAETSLTLEVIFEVSSMLLIVVSQNHGFTTWLYTEDYFVNEMSSHGIPEMQRSNLVSSVIQLKALGIDNILGFDWLHHHHLNQWSKLLKYCIHLEILDDDAKLTSPVGFQVAELPLSIWISVKGQRELDEAKLRFAAAKVCYSKHIT